jgi:hypothetical protein
MKKLIAIILLCAVQSYATDVVLGTYSELTNWIASATDRIAQFGAAGGAPPAVWDTNLICSLYWSNQTESVTGFYADVSGWGNHGGQDDPTRIPAWTNAPGPSLIFDGVDDQVRMTNTIGTTSITVMVWAKPYSVTGEKDIFNSTDWYGTKGLSLNIYNGNVGFGIATPSWHYIVSSATVTNGGSYFLVGVYDGATIHIYLDGVEIAASACTGAMVTPDLQCMRLGVFTDATHTGNYNQFSGELGPFNYYFRALSSNEQYSAFTSSASTWK